MDVFYFVRCRDVVVLFAECYDTRAEMVAAVRDAALIFGCRVKVRRLSRPLSSLWGFSVSQGAG
jgi:hypothetical protein